MLRPVEFDAAGNPRAGKTDERRLDDLVVIDEVVAVGFIIGALNTAAELGQHHHADIFVFKPYGGIGLIGLFVEDFVDDRQGIDLAARTLIDALFKEHRVLIRSADAVGRDHDGFNPDFCLTVDAMHG